MLHCYILCICFRYKPEISGSPGFGQPTALDVWKSIVKSLHPGSKITLLANGPLTNLAEILLSENNTDSVVQVIKFGTCLYRKQKELDFSLTD